MPQSGAFTLVELLVVIGIIALLISVLLPSLNKARQQANTLRSMSALRQITTSYLDYANANRGALLPGFLPERWPNGNEPEVSDKASGHVFVGRAARQWPWRLAGMNPSLWKLIRPTLDPLDLPQRGDTLADADAKAYAASQYPIYGLNTVFLGGHAPSKMTDIGTAKDYYRGFATDGRPNTNSITGTHVAFRVTEVRRTSEQIVFAEVAIQRGARNVDEQDLNGLHYVNPPRADVTSGIYWNVVSGKPNVLIAASTNRVFGVPYGRAGANVPVSFLDGHVETRRVSDLQDMHNWAPRATGASYQY